ncbi:hypothetical protein LTR62_007883 [Meristemomyces frigidus]|uniref:Uncharacterized protein n=1 Tax=Meristemomyces frigidus TaxID=1508187 RepID=A0AAN7YD77_9PEZI|nr:hypothetical protein LTR62_007883 [Meristemomyces frigidus]
MALHSLFFWHTKQSLDNTWHPLVTNSPTTNPNNLPPFLKRVDIEATAVDASPFIAGAGALAHLRQANDFGFTARASVFRNPKTLRTLHRATLITVPVVLACQAAGVEYRYFIPRWSHERERRREDEEVRRHVAVGMVAGMACWVVRIYGLRKGRLYWAPVDVVLGGALADLLHREYGKAHGL